MIARIELERTLKLGQSATLAGRCQAQWADSHVLSSDQISAGGVDRARGFDETVGYASKGLVASIELQSCAYQTFKAGEFQALAFLDGAVLNREQPLDAGQLTSAGVGVRWRYEDRLLGKIYLGIPIDFPEDEDGAALLHFSVSATGRWWLIGDPAKRCLRLRGRGVFRCDLW